MRKKSMSHFLTRRAKIGILVSLAGLGWMGWSMSAGSPGSTARTEGRPFPPGSQEEGHAQVSDDEAIPRDKVAAWSDERRRERVLREFRGWLADLERSRICDRSEAVVEIPISPALRRRLALPDGQATSTVDSKYLVIARPSAEEVEEVAGRIAALAAQDEEPSVLAGRLTTLAGQFMDYPATHKLVVLSKARASYATQSHHSLQCRRVS